jgi:hypothetical protein
MQPLPCANCHHVHDFVYCPHCGQKRLPRFTLPKLLETVHDALEIDKGVLLTVRELTLRPGKMIHQYWAGNTKSYTNPIRLLLVILAINVFLNSLILKELFRNLDNETKSAKMATLGKLLKEAVDFLSNEHVLPAFNLILLPMYAYLLHLFFRKRDITYAEHLIAFTYLQAGSTLVIMPWTLVCIGVIAIDKQTGFLLQSFTALFTFIYLPYFFGSVYGQAGQQWKAILRGFAAFLIGSFITSGLVIGGYLLWHFSEL